MTKSSPGQSAASHGDYEQPPYAPGPQRAGDDTSEPAGDTPVYSQPPRTLLRPPHVWEAKTSADLRHPRESRQAALPIVGFSLSLAGHLLTWTSLALRSTSPWVTLGLAAVLIAAGITASSTALLQSRLGIFRGPRWAGFGLILGLLWVLLAVALAVVVVGLMLNAPWADF